MRRGEVKSLEVIRLMKRLSGGGCGVRRWIHEDCQEAVSVDRVSRGAAFFASGPILHTENDVPKQRITAHCMECAGKGGLVSKQMKRLRT